MVGIEFGSGLRLVEATWSLIPKFALRILALMMVYLWFNTRFFKAEVPKKTSRIDASYVLKPWIWGSRLLVHIKKFRRIAISSVIRNTSSRKLEDVHPNLGAKHVSAMNTRESFFGVV